LALKRSGLYFLLTWAVLACVVSVHADSDDSTVRISIGDLGKAVASVQIQLVGDADRRWSVNFDQGDATVRHLPPGAYDVAVTPARGATVHWPIRLQTDEVVSILITMPAGAPVVHVVNRGRTSQGTTFDREDLQILPAGGDLSGLLDAAMPFVITDRIDNGGLSTGAWLRAGNRGASWTANSLTIGDLHTTNTMLARTWSYLPDLAMAERVSVLSGGLDPSVDAAGAAITIAPRRPGPTWWRSLDAAGTMPRMVSRASGITVPAIGRLDKFGRVGLEAGGPVHERLGLFVAIGRNRSQAFRKDAAQPDNARATSLFASLIARPSDRDEVRFQTSVQRLGHLFDGHGQFRDPHVSERDALGHATITWNRQRPDGAQTEYSFAVERTSVEPLLTDTTGGSIDRIRDGLIPTPAATDVKLRFSGRADVDLPEFGAAGRRHLVRVGATMDRSTMSSDVLATPAVAELVDGLPARVWIPQAPAADASRGVVAASAFASDRIAFNGHVTLDLSLRAMISSGSARGGTNRVTWASLAPRASLRWGGAAGAIFATYGRYQAPVPLAYLAFGDPNGSLSRVYRWADVNGNAAFDAGEQRALVALVGTNRAIASIDPDLASPRTDEFSLTAEMPLGASMRVRGTIVARREQPIVRAVNVGAPLSSYRPVQTFDAGSDHTGNSAGFVTIYERLPATFGQDRYLLTNPANDEADYGGIEVAWDLRTRRWSAMAGAMAYRTSGTAGNRGARADENDQGVIGERFATPNAAPPTEGAFFFDRSYVLKWSTSFRPGRNMTLAFTARYQDGQPFGRLVVSPALAQGPDFVTVDRVGNTRFMFLGTIDARIGKTFVWGPRESSIMLDVFNITNRRNEVEENLVAGVPFRSTTAVQPPRTLRLLLRMGF
jgi:hypothetical protein